MREKNPSISGELKYSVSLKKTLAGDGDWHSHKEILGWVVNTSNRILRLTAMRIANLKSLLFIPLTHRRLSRKD